MYKFSDFKQHVLSIKNRALSVLCSIFESIDSHLVDNFKSTQGKQIMTNFADDIESFISVYSVYQEGNCLNDYLVKHAGILGNYTKYIKLETLYLGYLINLPWPLTAIDIESSRGIPISEFVAVFNIALKLIDDNWDTLISFPEFGIWEYVNSLASYLNDFPPGNKVKHSSRVFLTTLFIFSAMNSLNNLCKMLLTENMFLAHAVLNQSKYTNWVFIGLVGDSVDVCLEKFNNIEILALVNEILSGSREFFGSRPRATKLYDESDLLPQAALKAPEIIETKSKDRQPRRKSFFGDREDVFQPNIRRNKSNLASLSFLGVSPPDKKDFRGKSGIDTGALDPFDSFDSVI
jgi:hypothetical protein